MKDFFEKNKVGGPVTALPLREHSPRQRGARSYATAQLRPRSETKLARLHKVAQSQHGATPLIYKEGQSAAPRPYRENVVGFILNRKNEVLIMKRARARWHWQLPQGGVEPPETKREAVLREMREETGLKGLRIIGVVENFHAYDWPRAPLYARDEYRGQRQTLFFLRYTAKGLGVALDPKEATSSRWVPIKDLLKWLAPVRHIMAKKALHSYQQLFTKRFYEK